MKVKTYSYGQTIIELLVIMAISAILLPALYYAFISARDGKVQQLKRFEAVNLLKETTEAVRTVRESGWDNINDNGTYYPRISGSTWVLTSITPPGELTSNGFYRLITISDVRRDATGAIVSSGGTIDPSTKKVDTTISWTTPRTTSISSTQYITRYLENASYTETTETQFNAGTKSGVTVRATNPPAVADDGEIILGAGGYGNWCGPNLAASQINLSGGIADSIIASEGKAYVGTGQNASGLPFIYIGINNNRPPTATQLGTSTLNYKANSVYGDGNVGYIGTDTNSKEVVMINLAASPPYPEIGYFNAPGNGNGDSIYITSNYGYVVSNGTLYNFRKYGDTTSPIDSTGVSLSATGTRVVVIGNYAYVAISGSTYEMDIINISNPTNLVRVGRADVNGQAAKDVAVSSDGNRAYLVTGNSSTQNEFFIINTQNKANPVPVSGGVYSTGSMDPRGLAIVPGNYAVLVGWGNNEYQVLNIGNENAPTQCGFLNTSFNINGIAAVTEADGDVFAYIVTNDGAGEFKIIMGGPGGSYATDGTFESATFNPGYSTANNRFQANFVQPAGTNIRFQVSMANLVAGNCPTSGYTFVGPSGTEADWFEQNSGESVSFPFVNYGAYTNPGQCIRYKVNLTTSNGTSTPVLNDITVNYSP